MFTNILSLSLEDGGGNSHLLELGIIISNFALIIVSLALTVVTALNDNAMIKIVQILHPRRVAKRAEHKRPARTADPSTEDKGDER